MDKIYVFASVKNTKSTKGNLGDLFGYTLIEYLYNQYLSNEYNIKVKRLGINDNIKKNTIAIVGSICHLCNIKSVNNKITIIGCGMIKNDNIKWNNKNIKWVGVRGPKTLEKINVPCRIISDPGLLISDIFKIKNCNNKKSIGYIIHSVDRDKFFKLFPEKRQYLINNYSNYEEFIDKLSQYEKVISSSLHGIIFCHSYSIPVCSIKVTDNIIGNEFKFIDYYHSIGYKNYKKRHLINNDINFEKLVNSEWQPDKKIITKLKELQKNIIINEIKQMINK